MMRWRWTYIVFAVLMLAGCVDRSYGGMEDEEIFDDLTEPIPVKIHIGSAETIVPKGSGVIADVTEWKGEKFYVYAFSNDMFSTYDVTSKTDNSRCLIDGSKDIPGTMAGKQAYMMETTNMVAWSGPDERVYYPFGSESGIVYDFFAYYIDDIKVEEKDITRLEDRIMIRVEIDGSQDLMSSKARVLADQLAGFDDEQERLYMENFCYSYYAARKGIDPVFVFKHHLTKLDFTITPKYNPTGKRTVHVKAIEVRTKYRAQFTVADRGSADSMGLLFDDDDGESCRRHIFLCTCIDKTELGNVKRLAHDAGGDISYERDIACIGKLVVNCAVDCVVHTDIYIVCFGVEVSLCCFGNV